MSTTSIEAAFTAALAIESCQTLASLQKQVRDYATPNGFTFFAIFAISPNSEGLNERAYWLEGDWFHESQTLDAATYFRECPATQHMLNQNRPFFWSKTPQSDGSEHYLITNKPRGSGLHGLQVPIFGPLGLEGAVSFAGKQIDSSPKVRMALELIAHSAFHTAERLIDGAKKNTPRKLSPREQEVLALTAAGRRQSDIADSLGITTRTVENHLRRIRQRLNVQTTGQAIRVAIRIGDLEA